MPLAYIVAIVAYIVAIADDVDGTALIISRWFGAVVTDVGDGQGALWNRFTGRSWLGPAIPTVRFPVGSRAYASSGLSGAEWWVAGYAAVRAGDADVDADQVVEFFTAHGLWARPSTQV